MATVYIETSVISHATARPAADPMIALLQVQARDWWRLERANFELVTSQLVIKEVSAGDPIAAAEHLKLLENLPLIPITDEVFRIADALLSGSLMPLKAAADALHVAAAAVSGIEYLLTQNCRHIANAHTLPRVYETLRSLGCPRLLICTPPEFLGERYGDSKSDS
jgi:hypothetical protein